MTDCSVCGKSFDDEKDYERHIEQAHEVMYKDYPEVFCKAGEGYGKCPECGSDMILGAGVGTSECPNCGWGGETPKEADEIEQHKDKPIQSHDEWQKELEGLKNQFSTKEAKIGGFDDDRISISHYKGDNKWENIKDADKKDAEEEGGADDPLKKVADLAESWHTLKAEEKAKIFESLGINQGSAYTLANLDWYNLSPQLKKDASEAYAKEEDELVIDNDEDLYALHKGLMDKPIKDDDKEINEAYRDIYNIEKNHLSPDYKKKAIECSGCNLKFDSKENRDIHFNEIHATEQEYNLPEECPFCQDLIKEPETLDYHLEKEHGVHVPSQYTQTGITGAMADTDFDKLETDFYTEAKEGWYVLTVGDDLWHYDTREEAENAVKNFPAGTYQIGEESKANEARWECLDCDSEFDDAGKHQEETGHHNIARKKANEDDMDDLQYRQQFGHDWWDKKARKERLKREGKESDGWSECEDCNFIGTNNEDTKKHEQETGHKTSKYSFQPVVPTFLKGESIDGHDPEEMIKREHELMGEEPEPKEKKVHDQLKKEFGNEDDVGFTRKCFDWEGYQIDCETGERIGQGYSQSKAYQKFLNESKAMERGQPNMEECSICGKLMNIDKLAEHKKKEHGEQ